MARRGAWYLLKVVRFSFTSNTMDMARISMMENMYVPINLPMMYVSKRLSPMYLRMFKFIWCFGDLEINCKLIK